MRRAPELGKEMAAVWVRRIVSFSAIDAQFSSPDGLKSFYE
jgi:hypothetical protein